MNAMSDTPAPRFQTQQRAAGRCPRGARSIRPALATTGDAELPLTEDLLRRLRESGL